jgi:hypothetical protein
LGNPAREGEPLKTEYKIEKNVPIPANGFTQGLTAAIRRMVVGDSILIEETQRSSALAAARKAKIRITSRKVGDKVRVWRTV